MSKCKGSASAAVGSVSSTSNNGGSDDSDRDLTSEEELDDEEYEVEEILDERVVDGKEEYLIKWKHFSTKESTWERKRNLNCDRKLAEFKRSLLVNQRNTAGTAEPEPGPSSSISRSSPEDLVEAEAASSSASSREESEEENGGNGSGAEDGVAGGGISFSSAFAGEIHPLLNPVILANLFQLCPLEILPTSRLVCRGWHESSLFTWRSSSILTLKYPAGWNTPKPVPTTTAASDSGEDSGSSGDDDDNDNYDIGPVDSSSSDEDDDANKNSSAMKSSELTELLDFLERECQAIPYRQFHLKNWEFEASNGNDEEDGAGGFNKKWEAVRLWNLIKGDVTRLQLSNCAFKDAAAFRRTIFQSCSSMKTLILHSCRSIPILKRQPRGTEYQEPLCGEHPKLRSLSVYTDCRTTGRAQKLPVSWLELLSHFSSQLTQLSLSYDDYYGKTVDVADVMVWLDAIRMIRAQDHRKLPLLQFQIEPPIILSRDDEDEQLCRNIQRLNLPLESIRIALSCDVNNVLWSLLSFQGNALRKIESFKYEYVPRGQVEVIDRGFPCIFPVGLELNTLTELVVRSRFFKNMEFIKHTPSLKKLHISSKERGRTPSKIKIVTNTPEGNMIGVKLPTLKELWMGYSLADEDVPRLCKWLPNVQILTMFFNDEKFAAVCEHWRDLRHVHHLGSPLNLRNEGITGGLMGYDGDTDTDEEILPNITFLQKLECFRFDSHDCKLTDASVYNGFLKLPKLRILEIPCYERRISNRAVRALREKIPHCQVRLKAEDWHQESWIRTRKVRCDYFN